MSIDVTKQHEGVSCYLPIFQILHITEKFWGAGNNFSSKMRLSLRFFLSFGRGRGSIGIESYDVPWASHELTLKPSLVSNSFSSCLSLPSAGLTGMYHHAYLLHRISKHLNKSFFVMSANIPESWTIYNTS